MKPTVVIVMGVAGAGKTEVGRRLASALGWRFVDADSFHSLTSVEKMRNGIALTDTDRDPWLRRLRSEVIDGSSPDQPVVLACSCLKATYRHALSAGRDDVRFVYLNASMQLVRERLATRVDHFAGVSLADSQFRELEEPVDAVIVDASLPPASIVEILIRELK